MNSETDTPDAQPRKPIWEINSMLRCPILGLCLTLSEQKQILKKARVSHAGLSPHDMHAILGQGFQKEGPLARRVQRTLDTKYRREIADCGVLTENKWLSWWKERLEQGQIEGALWAVATHPNLPETVPEEIWGDVHMYPFLQSHRTQEVLHQVRRLRTEHQALSQNLRETRKRAHALDKTLRRAEQTQATQARKIESLSAENEDLKRNSRAQQFQTENAALRVRLEKTEQQLQTRSTAVERLKAKNEQLTTELATRIEVNQVMRAEIEGLLQETFRDESQCEQCPNYDLCARRVLLVGGITKLSAFYRDLVEKMGGKFVYHDGYVSNSNGGQALANLVRRADVVLCPVDVNSHNACLGVKKFCKKWETPYHMLHSSSVSSIHHALMGVAGEMNGRTGVPV